MNMHELKKDIQRSVDIIQREAAKLDSFGFDMSGTFKDTRIVNIELVTPRDVLLAVIDYNAQTQPMPEHCNRELMTTALKMEKYYG